MKVPSKGLGKGDGISPVGGTSIQDYQAEHLEKVRAWLSRMPFAALVTSLRSGTRQDQLSSMRRVEGWLLQNLLVAQRGRYTRKRFFEETRSLLGLVGVALDSSLLKEYQSTTPKREMMKEYCR